MLRRTQVGRKSLGTRLGPLHFHSFLDFDSWDASGVLTLSYSKQWRPVRSLTATLTGKTVDLDHVSLITCLKDAWGSLMVCSTSPPSTPPLRPSL